MFNRGNRLALRYALSRTHLLEKHVNALYAFMKLRFPEESDFFDDLLRDWQADVGRMHDAFLQGNENYFDDYERRSPKASIA